jgi:hypothetical protein
MIAFASPPEASEKLEPNLFKETDFTQVASLLKN